MEIFKEFLLLVREIAWPAVILTIALLFRKPILAVLSTKQRNLRLKMGAFEVETQLTEQAQALAKEIALEPDLKKRLELAKAPLFVEAAVRAVEPKDVELLSKLHAARLTNAFHINWYNPELDGIDVDACRRLIELGVISMNAMYDGDEIGRVTPTGLALLERITPTTSGAAMSNSACEFKAING